MTKAVGWQSVTKGRNKKRKQEMIKTSLTRKLGFFPATNIVIANMIGAGIFTTSGLLLADLHHPLLMIGLWIIGGMIALCGSLSYGELGAAIPEAGGEYLFLSRIFHPIFGFLSGWLSFIVGFTAAIAASSIGFSEYLLRAFPEINSFMVDNLHFSSLATQKIISLIIILLFTVLHSGGLKTGIRVQNVLTILKVVLIVGLVGITLLSSKGDVSHFHLEESIDFRWANWKTIGLSLMWIMFAYSGWNASTYIGSEIKNPLRNLPASLLAGTFIVIFLYIALNIVFVYAIPPSEMKGVISVGGLAMGKLFGPVAERLFSVLISFALFSSLSAFIIVGPRVYYSMAKDGLFFESIAKVHPRFGVPSTAIIWQGTIAAVFVLSGTFEQILTYLGFSLGIFPILTVAALIKLRIKKQVPVKLPGFPVVQIVYILAGTLILLLAFLERPLESGVAIVTLLAGIPVYWMFKKLK